MYTDLVCNGDKLLAQEKNGNIATFFVVNTRKDIAVNIATNKQRKINRRGNMARVFVGNSPVIARL